MSTDTVEKQAVLKAPLQRVWSAISDARQFGAWFGLALEGEFQAGQTTRGRITHPGYEHLTAELFVERIVPPTYFSYRWHPYAVDPTLDYSGEPTTLVEFELAEVPEGTRVTIRESGFDRLPPGRRAEALPMNSGGWDAQLQNVTEHVARR